MMVSTNNQVGMFGIVTVGICGTVSSPPHVNPIPVSQPFTFTLVIEQYFFPLEFSGHPCKG